MMRGAKYPNALGMMSLADVYDATHFCDTVRKMGVCVRCEHFPEEVYNASHFREASFAQKLHFGVKQSKIARLKVTALLARRPDPLLVGGPEQLFPYAGKVGLCTRRTRCTFS